MAQSFQIAAADAAVTHAQTLLRQGRFGQAQKSLEQALAKDPQSLEANIAFGELLEYMGESKEALKYFKAAAEAHPEELWAHVALGAGLLNADKYDQSMDVSEKAISKFEKKATDKELLSRLWVNLAGAQGLKAKREGVFAMIRFGTAVRGNLEKALSIDSNSRTLYALGRYYVEAPGAVGGDPKKGLPLLSKAIKLEPTYYAIQANYLRGLIASGQKAEAKEAWSRFRADFADYAAVMADVKDIASALSESR